MRWPGLPREAWGKLTELWRRVESLSNIGGDDSTNLTSGPQPFMSVDAPQGMWVRITGGVNPYSGASVFPTSLGTFASESLATLAPPYVTFNATTNPLYEVNGNTSVPEGAIVWATPHSIQREDATYGTVYEWEFDYSSGIGEPKFWAVILNSDDIRHAWVEVLPANEGTWDVKPGGRTGSITVNPAFERNLLNSVSAGTVVLMYVGYLDAAPDLQEYIFEYPVPRMQEDGTILRYQQRLNFKQNILAENDNVTHATNISVCKDVPTIIQTVDVIPVACCELLVFWEERQPPCMTLVDSGVDVYDTGCCSSSSSSSSSSSICTHPLCWSILDFSTAFGGLTNLACTTCDVECYKIEKTTETVAGWPTYSHQGLMCCTAPGFSISLVNGQDGYIYLVVSTGGGAVIHYRKLMSEWACNAVNEVAFYRNDEGGGDIYCVSFSNFPSTITLDPSCCTPVCSSSSSSSSISSPSSSSSSCAACGACDATSTMMLTFPTIDGTDCGDLTGPQCLAFDSACYWTVTVGTHRIDLRDLGGCSWELKVFTVSGEILIATWTWTGSQTSPCDCMLMTKTQDTSECADFPTNVMVCPVGPANLCCEVCETGGPPESLWAEVAVTYDPLVAGCEVCNLDPGAPPGTLAFAGAVKITRQADGHWTGSGDIPGSAVCQGSIEVDLYCDSETLTTCGSFNGTCIFKIDASACETLNFDVDEAPDEPDYDPCSCDFVDPVTGVHYGYKSDYYKVIYNCCGPTSPGTFSMRIEQLLYAIDDPFPGWP